MTSTMYHNHFRSGAFNFSGCAFSARSTDLETSRKIGNATSIAAMAHAAKDKS
jgi:hypothetical protein